MCVHICACISNMYIFRIKNRGDNTTQFSKAKGREMNMGTQWIKPVLGIPVSCMGCSLKSLLLHFQRGSLPMCLRRQQNCPTSWTPASQLGDLHEDSVSWLQPSLVLTAVAS